MEIAILNIHHYTIKELCYNYYNKIPILESIYSISFTREKIGTPYKTKLKFIKYKTANVTFSAILEKCF